MSVSFSTDNDLPCSIVLFASYPLERDKKDSNYFLRSLRAVDHLEKPYTTVTLFSARRSPCGTTHESDSTGHNGIFSVSPILSFSDVIVYDNAGSRLSKLPDYIEVYTL